MPDPRDVRGAEQTWRLSLESLKLGSREAEKETGRDKEGLCRRGCRAPQGLWLGSLTQCLGHELSCRGWLGQLWKPCGWQVSICVNTCCQDTLVCWISERRSIGWTMEGSVSCCVPLVTTLPSLRLSFLICKLDRLIPALLGSFKDQGGLRGAWVSGVLGGGEKWEGRAQGVSQPALVAFISPSSPEPDHLRGLRCLL